MTLHNYLDENAVPYRTSRHDHVFSAQELAAAEHVSGKQVIKPVLIRADGQLVLCVLPACYRIDLDELKRQLPAWHVELVDEPALASACGQWEPGALPPIGRLYGIPTLMDESLLGPGHLVTFAAGTHQDAVTMTLAAYRRIAQPELAHFGRPMPC